MLMRLETVARELSEKLRMASPEQQKAASFAACQLALQAVKMDISIVFEAVEELRKQGVLSNRRVTQLNDLVAQLDQVYFDLQDRSNDEPDLQREALRLLGQARAVSALSLAGGGDTFVAAMEAIYEASVTVNDPSKIYDAALLAL